MNEKLLTDLKKEVKQIIEEAVTRKFIHADSTSITSLCGVVDAIIQRGLKRRAGGILPPYDTETMLLKLAELSPAAETLVRKLTGLDVDDSIIEMTRHTVLENEVKKPDLKVKKLNLDNCKLPYGKTNKFLWIRVALVEKILAQVVTSLVEHSNKFYEPNAILANVVNGPLVANLLDGPCALDYSKMKTPDSRWSDPSADELVQRHRIHSGLSMRRRQSNPFSKPQLAEHSPSVEEFIVAPTLAREHVESLHQNAGTTMLFGKNNVEVQPTACLDWMPGYLSLHQTPESLLLKWTPNDLMNGSPEEHQILNCNEAITIDTLDVVYVHCHHKGEAERVMVLIAQDGVQRPPIRFPTTGSLMRFLECLETGLVPYGRLDPPLANDSGNGILFDSPSRRGAMAKLSFSRNYVFRLVPSVKPEDIGLDSNLNLWATTSTISKKKKKSRKSAEKSKMRTISLAFSRKPQAGLTRASLESACLTMKNQITYRAMKGWLSHVHHLATVRKHLSSLIQPVVFEANEVTRKGLTERRWAEFYSNEKLDADETEIAKFVYHGGVAPKIRYLVWPYLLGYHKFRSTPEERSAEDARRVEDYNKLLTEWENVEEFLGQRNHAEADRDSAEDSASSKEDIYNDNQKNDNTKVNRNGVNTPETSSLCNGELTNGYLHDDNDTVEAAQNTEHDSESGCYDCGDDVSKQLESLSERCSVCGFEINGGSTECGGGELTNGCRSNGDSVYENHVGDRTYCVCKNGTRILSRLRSYSDDLLDNFALNIHRIDKDVLRCDRNYPYFNLKNLEKLRRIMCTYVWNTLDIGYVQGMCDLLAPILVIFDDEAMSYHCFVLLMKRMDRNFPHGGTMDSHFANMRSLIQILDSELFEVMQQNGDLTHCYFCYRWFLLDFKREFLYEDIFRVWECIWAAQICSSKHFVLFIALAILKSYRNIVIDHGMDFTDVIKFFNEMAERHNATQILDIARSSVKQVETLIQNE